MRTFRLNKLPRLEGKKLSTVLFLFLLLLLTSIITYYKIKIEIGIGPQWDTFDFLSDALYFSGHGFGYIDLIRPPFLPFLTSIFFKLGYISEATIFAIDGVLFVFGVMGLYLFFKLRFNNITSLLGALLFISFPVVLLWVGAGYTDVASMSLSIWALYFTILAVQRNSKYFYLSFPMAMLAFLTRFPAALIIFPLFFYIAINRTHLKNLNSLIGGIFISFLVTIPVFIFFYNVLGNPLQPFLEIYNLTVSSNVSERFAYNPDLFYFIKNAIYCTMNTGFLESFSAGTAITLTAGIVLICSSIIGIIMYTHKIIPQKISLKSSYNRLKLSKSPSLRITAIIILLILLFISLGRVHYLFSDFIFLIICYITYNLLKNDNLKKLDIDFLFFSWLISYLIFDSAFQIKVLRYFIPMAPAFSYFIILGWNEFSGKLNLKIKTISTTSIMNIIFILALLLSVNSYLHQLEYDPLAHGQNFVISKGDNPGFTITGKPNSGELYFENYNTQNEMKVVSSWFTNYDSNYKNKIIYSDYFWPHLSWYLKTEVKGIPNQNKLDLNSELEKRNVDYYINILYDVNLRGYIKIKEFKTRFGDIVIYKRK